MNWFPNVLPNGCTVLIGLCVNHLGAIVTRMSLFQLLESSWNSVGAYSHYSRFTFGLHSNHAACKSINLISILISVRISICEHRRLGLDRTHSNDLALSWILCQQHFLQQHFQLQRKGAASREVKRGSYFEIERQRWPIARGSTEVFIVVWNFGDLIVNLIVNLIVDLTVVLIVNRWIWLRFFCVTNALSPCCLATCTMCNVPHRPNNPQDRCRAFSRLIPGARHPSRTHFGRCV